MDGALIEEFSTNRVSGPCSQGVGFKPTMFMVMGWLRLPNRELVGAEIIESTFVDRVETHR